MIEPKVGFIVYGVHKDGLKDPMGQPFIDDALVARAEDALTKAGLKLVRHPVVIASKEEAITALRKMKHEESVDAVILFSGTWVWAAHLVGAIRDYASTGKGVLLWTHPGSQGWRPVGGLVMHGGLLEIGVPHKFVYGAADDSEAVEQNRQLRSRGAHEELAESVHDRHLWRTWYGTDLWRCRSIAMDAHVRSRHRFSRYQRTPSNGRADYASRSRRGLSAPAETVREGSRCNGCERAFHPPLSGT